jgi:hypothetical protein
MTAIFTRDMPSFEVDRETINVFDLGENYLFKQYFEQDELFADLQRYYNNEKYRFEVPQDAFETVVARLEEHFYDPVPVEEVEPFCVVKQKYTDHPDILFKTAVAKHSVSDHTAFLLKDQLSVEQAIEQGATRLAETDLDSPF